MMVAIGKLWLERVFSCGCWEMVVRVKGIMKYGERDKRRRHRFVYLFALVTSCCYFFCLVELLFGLIHSAYQALSLAS